MTRNPDWNSDLGAVLTVRNIMIAVALFGLLAFFLLWQIENERMERVRAALIDRLTPLVELGNKPIEFGVFLSETVQEHFNHLDRITGLEQEVTRLEHWARRGAQTGNPECHSCVNF